MRRNICVTEISNEYRKTVSFVIYAKWQKNPGKTPDLTFVFELIGAPLSSIMSTTCSCPDLAAQWSAVRPSRVLDSMLAPFSRSRDTMLVFPHFAATCNGVILCYENVSH